MDKLPSLIKAKLLTALNLLYTSVLLWLSTAGNLPPVEAVADLVPEGLQPLVRLAFPILAGIVVQVAGELLKKDATDKATAG